MESCGAICPFAVFACQMWWKLLFQTIDHWILCWLCWWARCWMLQGMDYLEVSCVFLVKVGTLDQLEQNKICILTITLLGIAILTIQHAMIFSVCFMKHPGDVFRQISRDVFSVNECPFYMHQSWDFCCHAPRDILVNTQATSDCHTTNHTRIVNCCNVRLYAARFSLSRLCKLAVTHSNLTWSWLYIPQDLPVLVVIIFLFFSTTANRGSTNTCARCERIWI